MNTTSCVALLTLSGRLQGLWGPLDLDGDALRSSGRVSFCVDVSDPGLSDRGVTGGLRGDGPAGVVCGQGDLGFEEEMLLGFWGGGAGATAGMGEEGGAQLAGLGQGGLIAAAGAQGVLAVGLFEVRPGGWIALPGLNGLIVKLGTQGHRSILGGYPKNYSDGTIRYASGVPLTLERFGEEFVKRRQDARDCLAQQMTGIFVGAGLEYGFSPSWDGLVIELLKECRVVLPEGEWSNPQKADFAKKGDLEQYQQVILRNFRRWFSLTQQVTTLIPELNIHSVVTTNYGNDLYQALERKNFIKVALPDLYPADATKSKRIFYIHGHLDEELPDEFNIILSEEEYAANYGFAGVVKAFINSYFTHMNIIFIGFSFADTYVVGVLNELSELERKYNRSGKKSFRAPKRFALMGIKIESDESKGKILDFGYIQKIEEQLDRLNITPIWYDSEDNHRQLYNIIKGWVTESGQSEGLSEAVI